MASDDVPPDRREHSTGLDERDGIEVQVLGFAEIKKLKSGEWRYETIEVPEMNIRAYGDAAVAVYLANVSGTFDGKPAKFQGRAVCVWAKKNGQWKVVALQFARVAQPKQ